MPVPTSAARTARAEVVALAALVDALATTQGSPGLPAMALAPGAPDPASIPDLTFGLGSRAYNAFQNGGAALASVFLNNVNLSGALQGLLGFNPEAAINTALGNLLVQALTGVTLPVNEIPVLGSILNSAGITNVAALLNLLGVDIADPLNATGINLITAGPPFSLLKFLGVDLGWVPGVPNAVADEINGTEYLGLSPVEILETLKNSPGVSPLEKATLDTLITTVKAVVGEGDAIDVRVPRVVGFGPGAFAAGMAYPQVVADLANQPGGENYTGPDVLAGSITILPMLLLRNVGRANGGLAPRGYPVAGLLGIDTVTPDTEVVNSVNDGGLVHIPVGNTGIVVGGANLIPIKVDGTVEFDPMSDVPAWPNPVSLANSLAALAFPTYVLRGVTSESLTEVVENQLKPQVAEALANTDGPLALNLYLTVPVNGALPLLEPVKLPVDAINLVTGLNLNNPITTAFEPALTSLTNLGYTDVQRTVVNGVAQYQRTLDQADVITPFGTLPSGINWGQVPPDIRLQLIAGIQQAIAQGLSSEASVANPLATLANLVGLNVFPGAANTETPFDDTADPNPLSGSVDSAVDAAADNHVVPLAIPQREEEPKPDHGGNDDDITIDSSADAALDGGDGTPGTPAKPLTGLQNRVNSTVTATTNGLGNLVKGVTDGLQKTVGAVTGANKPADKPRDGDSGDSDAG